MKRRLPTTCWLCLTVTAQLAALTGGVGLGGCAVMKRYAYAESHMGVVFQIVCYSDRQHIADTAAAAAFRRIAAIDALASDYRPDSELNRLNLSADTAQPVVVSDDLWAMLERSQHWARQTDGAFDITIGALVKLWRQARLTRRMPDADRLAAARAATGYEHLRLSASHHTVTLRSAGMRLDLGAIAKGYAAQQALACLRGHGIDRAFIDAGGDVVLGRPPPGRSGWRVRLMPAGPTANRPAVPAVYLTLSNCAVATSGDAFRHVVIHGRRYSHIVDPHTGLGLTRPIGASIIAPNGADADALATAVCVLGPDRGLALIESLVKVDGLIVVQGSDGRMKTLRSARWDDLRLNTAGR